MMHGFDARLRRGNRCAWRLIYGKELIATKSKMVADRKGKRHELEAPRNGEPEKRVAGRIEWGRGVSRKMRLLLTFLGVGVCTLCSAAGAQNATFKIPAVKIPIKIKEQSIAITASGLVSLRTADQGASIVGLELTADLSELQRNLTDLLSAQLDKNDECGERIAIEHGELVPRPPASRATVQLHYERWACAKVLGKEKTKRLVGGNALIEMQLTPAVEQDGTELRLVPEVGRIDADGSLGELLRSGTLGDVLREKIRASILSALQKGTDLSATLPPAAQGYAKITNAQFRDEGSQRLQVVLEGEIQFTDQQIQELSKQVKERVAATK